MDVFPEYVMFYSFKRPNFTVWNAENHQSCRYLTKIAMRSFIWIYLHIYLYHYLDISIHIKVRSISPLKLYHSHLEGQ